MAMFLIIAAGQASLFRLSLPIVLWQQKVAEPRSFPVQRGSARTPASGCVTSVYFGRAAPAGSGFATSSEPVVIALERIGSCYV
ncbi:uncharacterized protein SPSK_03801 [Sporothrix schenckii 1099-18]|uniref:Secreted protein n=1 Tax=Sporothrix schenckii 1099-18 TaxID=1397361 RepID=A0A0F2LZ00_SPOSC|nr:uncharacterized protein SPSK_03801 [Sporothrix schenckii 1099-18]KJR82688.1 hypothetical protein SPSK_03801 [Sporothrix schenckii 1099-18]